ncbi:MAG: hypothetical protein K2X03_21180 [Bryobacteraceae bacterium]|nr:hypothetical protein [Bryobacteraceae bacterium]
MAKDVSKSKPVMTPEERSAEMRRRIMLRWVKKDPFRNTPGEAAIELVRHACSVGATVARICEVLDIPESKFKRFMLHPPFAAAVKAGRQIEHDALVNKLTELALGGSVTALIFALKSRHNYNDSGNGTATLVENKVSVNFVLPDALKPTEYLQTLVASAEVIAPGDAARALAKPGVKKAVIRQLVRAEGDNNAE